MKYIVLVVLLAGCVTSRAVETAQYQSMSCWQTYQQRPTPELYGLCRQQDMEAQNLAMRRSNQAQARRNWVAAQSRQNTSCRSTVVGNNVYTTCD